MKIQRQFQIQLIFLYSFVIKQILSAECPDIKILNPYKSRSWIVEGIQIYNSPIRLLRGAGQQGTNEQVSNIMVWDTTTNHCLKIFDLDLQVTKMLYSKVKRKLFVAGTHKILEIHPLTFKILDEYNIGGTHIADVEDSDSLILIARDQGNPFLYDIFLKAINYTLPYQYLTFFGEIWATMANLKDFRLFVNAKLMIFDRNDNYKMINFLYANSSSLISRVCAFQNQNFLLTTGSNERVQLGFYYRDQSGAVQYKYYDTYTEIYVPASSPVPIKIQDLWCIQRGNDNFVVLSISRTDSVTTLYKGATVLKINESVDPNTKEKVYSLSVQEKWKYRRWRKDMEFFMFDEATHRAQSISEYEHYSYEFLESDESQCDFDGDGINDSYCRMTKTISHWPWNLNMGVYFLGSKSEYFLYGQDNQKGYQIRDFNSTEILRFQYPRLIEKEIQSLKRIIQYEKSTYKLPYDTYIMKMCWIYDNFSEMKAGHNSTAGFYIYQHYSFQQRITDTYNLINYMNPPTNTEKYKNPYSVNSAFTYAGDLHVCVSYIVLEIDKNKNSDKIDLDQSYAYFSRHNKECYKLNNNIVVNFYQLKLSTSFIYGKGNTIYNKCSPYFEGGQLICRNSKPMLEFWSLDDYTLMKTVDIPGCTGDYDIAIHRKRFFIGCDSSIMIYDTNTLKLTTFQTNTNKIPLFVITVQDILAIAYSNMEIAVYDLRPVDGSAILVLNYLDPQDCCLINSIEIHPITKRLMWGSIIQINYVDLAPCLDDPLTCKQCEITAYFDYDPKFSFLKQKYDRAPWPIAQPQFYVNPKFLDSGQGTIDQPYLTDMNIMQLYFKTHYYKQNFLKFNSVTLNIYVNVKKAQYMGNSLVDWQHENTKVYFKPWDGTKNPTDVTGSKIKIVILSAKFFQLSFDNWGYLDMSNIQIVCPNCISNTMTFKNSGTIYLRNFLISLNIDDLIEPAQGKPDTRVFPNIKINVQQVDNFVLENQQVQNSINIDLNQIPFFTFANCKKVSMTNVVFSNIVNQESLFESSNSNIILENIVFTKINTCLETTTKRKNFSVVPFQNLIANNISFIDNQFCDMCLFQNLVSSSNSLETQLIKISNVNVLNNKFEKYQNSNILFLKMSLVSQISSTQSIEVSNVKFSKNTGSVNKDKTNYYFELIKLSSVLLQTINIVDENLVGFGSFNRLQKLEIQNLNFINSQYLPESNVALADTKKIQFSQNLILIQEVDKLIFYNSQINGFETKGIITIQIEENLQIDLKGIVVLNSSFIDSLFTSIQNSNKEITDISLSDSIFKEISLSTQYSHIQVGLFWIRAEKSNTLVTLKNNIFQNNVLSVNTNTQKKSSISFSIDNSISKLTIQECTFFNYYATSVLGDLFLNVQSLNMIKTTFQQNLNNLINTIQIPQNDSGYITAVITQMERTNMKGTFISIQAQIINLSECSFANAISTEGIIQMYPNNNYLSIKLDNCSFSNIYASTTGTAMYISSLTSPIDMSINNCHFNNLWLGNQQKQDKAHLYLESSKTNTNTITISNLDVYNIGSFISNNHIASYFIYQTAFELTLQNTVIQQPKIFRNLFIDKINTGHQNFEKNNYFFKDQNIGFSQNIQNKNRILETNSNTLSQMMKSQTFYGSSLIHSIEGTVKIQDTQIEGSALINNIYRSQTNTVEQPNILKADYNSTVQIKKLNINNLIANINGGIILLKESFSSIFDAVVIQNVEYTQNYIDSQADIYKEKGEAKAFINCIKTDCSYSKLQALCSKSDSNTCRGRVLNLQEGQFKINQSTFENHQLTNKNGTAIFVVNPQGIFEISNSVFKGLQTDLCGAGIYVFQDNEGQQPIQKINDNIFEKNTAGNLGGALSFESMFIQGQEKLNITNNQFNQNQARISGAIYFSSYYLDPNLLMLNQFQNNKADMAGDVFSEPIGLHIRFQNKSSDIDQNNDSITIKHGSGLQIPKFYVDLYYINSYEQESLVDVKFLSEQKEILQLQMSYDKQNPIKEQSGTQQDYYLGGTLYSQYDSENNQIYFSNLELYGKENTIIYLMITSTYIKDIQVNKDEKYTYEPYRFTIKVNFRPCLQKEIMTTHSIPFLSSSIKKCQACQDLTYAKDGQVCEQCPIGATCNSGEEMIVSQGYWRANYDTYSILSCSSGFDGCVGGQTIGDDLCQKGYIGPLCQECDLFNRRNQGRYTHFGKSLCKLCTFNFLGALMIFGSIFISVYFTLKAVRSNASFIEAKILVRFLKTIKFKRIRDVEKLQSKSIFIKILMTYFQLIGIIRTVDIKVPDFLPEMSFYFGNPASNSVTNLNCLMEEYAGSLHFIYYSFYLSLIIPFIHFLILAITMKYKASSNKEILNLTNLKTAIIFFFTYFQPEFIYQAFQIITCKQIDKISYNQLNVSLECDIEIAQTVILSAIIILLSLIIPTFLYVRLNALHNDESFKKIENQLKYSQFAFLCINYKHETYYWEFIRMAERMLFILVASIFGSRQILKIILLIFITEGYNILLKKKAPFKDDQFNSLEIAANHIITLSFIIAIGIYSQQLGYTMDVFFYIIFIIINYAIIVYIILLVLQEILYKIIDKLMTLIEANKIIKNLFEKIINCLNGLPFFKLNFNLKVYINKKKKPQLYAKIRETLLQILTINQEDRNYLFLSIKEQKNQSKYISNIMNQFQQQYKTNRSNLTSSLQASPTNHMSQKFESMFESDSSNLKKKLSDSQFLSKRDRQQSIFKSEANQSKIDQSDDLKDNIQKSIFAYQTTQRQSTATDQILVDQDQDETSSQNQPRTRNASFYESTFEQGLSQSIENCLHQFPADKIRKKFSDYNKIKERSNQIEKLFFGDEKEQSITNNDEK